MYVDLCTCYELIQQYRHKIRKYDTYYLLNGVYRVYGVCYMEVRNVRMGHTNSLDIHTMSRMCRSVFVIIISVDILFKTRITPTVCFSLFLLGNYYSARFYHRHRNLRRRLNIKHFTACPNAKSITIKEHQVLHRWWGINQTSFKYVYDQKTKIVRKLIS
jgi:hypothetical protein